MFNNFPTVLVRERDREILIRQGAEEIALNLDEGQELISLLREALEAINENRAAALQVQ
ncbi:MAG: hypothetical protein QOH31_4074 [Verrucomicrobiota bacterium]